MSYKFTFISYSPWWYITHPWSYVGDVYREIKSFLQRGYRGYADSDLWGFDGYLAEILSEGLKKFGKNIHSYPGYGMANTSKKWRAIIKEMRKGFALKVKLDRDYTFDKKKRKEYDKQIKKSFHLLEKYFENLWN